MHPSWRILCWVAPLAVALALASCSQGGAAGGVATSTSRPSLSAGQPASGVTTYEIDPTTTNPDLTGLDRPNFVALDPSVPSNGELFVFFPGTGGQPDCCRYLVETAAEMGFHAVGLSYLNSEAVATICDNDLACYGTVRQDDFDGSDPNAYVTVSPGDSIQSRLSDLLEYLATTYSTEGWSQFLEGSTPAWDKILVSGHSQGGGDAAFIGSIRRVEGVLMLSSVVDSSSTTPIQPATYLTTGHVTPLDRYIGFDHTRDPYYPKIATDWNALDLQSFGPPVSVDGTKAPFGHSHELTTSTYDLPGPAILDTHDSTAVDIQTPVCPDGAPAFAPVWEYMMEVAGGLRVTSSAPVCTGS